MAPIRSWRNEDMHKLKLNILHTGHTEQHLTKGDTLKEKDAKELTNVWGKQQNEEIRNRHPWKIYLIPQVEGLR